MTDVELTNYLPQLEQDGENYDDAVNDVKAERENDDCWSGAEAEVGPEKMPDNNRSSLVENEVHASQDSVTLPADQPGVTTPSGRLAISTDFTDPTANVIANVASVEVLQERVELSWRKIDVFAKVNRGSICKRLCCGNKSDEPQIKQILFDVSGKVKPGTLLAVMGASGAGKSTLMNVLAHRNLGKLQVSGEVRVNGHVTDLNINSMSAYVQQEDLFIGTLTVREHLTFNALLRMDKHVPKERRLQRVEEVLSELGLTKCADTIIGIPGRVTGISGGEKKRLSFASEVLNNPPLLFADEPTSGLDAFMAQNIVAALQRLASDGHTIICTIHQPSSEVYAMFDSILLMAEGRVAYLGPAAGAISHFARFGYQCPTNFNPADYFVMTLAVVPGREEECRERVKVLCDGYHEDELKRMEDARSLKRQDSFKDDPFVVQPSAYKASWWKQFTAVLWRCWISNNRDAIITRIRLLQNIVIGLIAGLIYFQLKYDQNGVQNISGALFFLVTNLSFGSLQGVIFVFPAELPVFMREHQNGLYRTDVYFLSKTLAELPIFLLGPLLLIGISYWMMGLRPDGWHFLVCYLVSVLITNVALSYGYLISTMVDTVTAASALGAPLMLPLLIFGGFFLKDVSVPVYFIWLKYLSWFKYGFEALTINQWKDYTGHIACNRNMTAPVPGRNGSSPNTASGCISTGNEVINFLSFDKNNFMIDIYAMLGLLVGFRLISFLFLLRRANKKQ